MLAATVSRHGSRMDYWSRRWYRLVWTQCESDGTAWRQGAYTGSKAMVGGAQVLLPVMSFDVSKGHSLKGSKFPLVEKEFSTGGK
ncbi:hypothetical protein PGTDC60_1615 [Porphyromonas gingivalis TDC60]|nr:hypothetical protein PGTDC60_1615 [Porphyromonas gingivalis TDC60]